MAARLNDWPRLYPANIIEQIGEKTENRLAERWAAQVTFRENVIRTCQQKKKEKNYIMEECS